MENKSKNYKKIILISIIIYFIIAIILYLTSNKVSSYKVVKGTLNNDKYYTGISVFDEEIIKSNTKGYVNYYLNEGSKVKVGEKIFTVSNSKLNENTISNPSYKTVINNFKDDYNDVHFSNTYNLFNSINNKLLDQSNDDNNAYVSKDSGIISYNIDSMVKYNSQNISNKIFNLTNYTTYDTRSNEKVNKYSPVAKIIKSLDWKIALNIDETSYKTLSNKDGKDIQIMFVSDNKTEWATFELKEKDNKYICILSLKNGLIRYYNDRFVDIKIILEKATGLKIPTSAIIEKSFFKIPTEYITTDDSTSKRGVILNNEDKKFVETKIYYIDEETNEAYVNISNLNIGYKLLNPTDNTSFTIEKLSKLKGVFLINKGYAEFKRVEILVKNKGWAYTNPIEFRLWIKCI